jgi:chorismate synthase
MIILRQKTYSLKREVEDTVGDIKTTVRNNLRKENILLSATGRQYGPTLREVRKQRKSFSKVLLPTGPKDIKDLDDKQLKNVANYGKSKVAKKNIRNNNIKLGIGSSVIGGLTGALTSGFNGKTAAKGATIGLGLGTGLALYGHHRNKKLAKEAEEELERRKTRNK